MLPYMSLNILAVLAASDKVKVESEFQNMIELMLT